MFEDTELARLNVDINWPSHYTHTHTLIHTHTHTDTVTEKRKKCRHMCNKDSLCRSRFIQAGV